MVKFFRLYNSKVSIVNIIIKVVMYDNNYDAGTIGRLPVFLSSRFQREELRYLQLRTEYVDYRSIDSYSIFIIIIIKAPQLSLVPRPLPRFEWPGDEATTATIIIALI